MEKTWRVGTQEDTFVMIYPRDTAFVEYTQISTWSESRQAPYLSESIWKLGISVTNL